MEGGGGGYESKEGGIVAAGRGGRTFFYCLRSFSRRSVVLLSKASSSTSVASVSCWCESRYRPTAICCPHHHQPSSVVVVRRAADVRRSRSFFLVAVLTMSAKRKLTGSAAYDALLKKTKTEAPGTLPATTVTRTTGPVSDKKACKPHHRSYLAATDLYMSRGGYAAFPPCGCYSLQHLARRCRWAPHVQADARARARSCALLVLHSCRSSRKVRGARTHASAVAVQARTKKRSPRTLPLVCRSSVAMQLRCFPPRPSRWRQRKATNDRDDDDPAGGSGDARIKWCGCHNVWWMMIEEIGTTTVARTAGGRGGQARG